MLNVGTKMLNKGTTMVNKGATKLELDKIGCNNAE